MSPWVERVTPAGNSGEPPTLPAPPHPGVRGGLPDARLQSAPWHACVPTRLGGVDGERGDFYNLSCTFLLFCKPGGHFGSCTRFCSSVMGDGGSSRGRCCWDDAPHRLCPVLAYVRTLWGKNHIP